MCVCVCVCVCVRRATYLSLRHDIEVVAVQGEGHVSQDGAAIFDDGYGLVLDSTVGGAVHPDLSTHRHTHTQKVSPGLYFNVLD